MKTRIFVGNIAYTATAEDIRNLFQPFGAVLSVYVHNSGKTRFAFLQISNEADADSAIER